MEPPLPAESQEKLLYLTSIYTQEDASHPSPASVVELRRQPVYTVENLQCKLKHSRLSRGLGRRVGRQELGLGGVEEEGMEEEEEEEEQGDGEDDDSDEEEKMETQSPLLEEPFLPENAAALAEKRMALQGSVWQVSTDEVKWRNFPLGRLPGQNDDPDALLVDNYTVITALDQMVNRDKKTSPGMAASEWGGSVAEGLFWTQSELHKLKSGLQLF